MGQSKSKRMINQETVIEEKVWEGQISSTLVSDCIHDLKHSPLDDDVSTKDYLSSEVDDYCDSDDSEQDFNEGGDATNYERVVTLPNEILLNIFKLLTRKELKNVSLVCKVFWTIARVLLWETPSLTLYISLGLLRKFAEYQLPIKHLCLSQFDFMLSDYIIKEVVEVLKFNFDLSTFSVGFDHITCKQLEDLLVLPIDIINTKCLSREERATKFVNVFVNCSDCPSLIIDPVFHQLLTLEDWEKLSMLPVVEINAEFSQIQGCIVNVEDYDRLVGKINPSPIFNLTHQRHALSAENLRSFRSIKLTKVDLAALSPQIPIRDYHAVLKENNQLPWIVIPKGGFHGFRLTPDDVALLCDFKILSLHSSSLDVMSFGFDKFADIIIENFRTSPINKVTLLRHHIKESCLDRLKISGVNWEITYYR